jgi:hypothetical protein
VKAEGKDEQRMFRGARLKEWEMVVVKVKCVYNITAFFLPPPF